MFLPVSWFYAIISDFSLKHMVISWLWGFQNGVYHLCRSKWFWYMVEGKSARKMNIFCKLITTIQLYALCLNCFDLQNCYTPFWKPQKQEIRINYDYINWISRKFVTELKKGKQFFLFFNHLDLQDLLDLRKISENTCRSHRENLVRYTGCETDCNYFDERGVRFHEILAINDFLFLDKGNFLT